MPVTFRGGVVSPLILGNDATVQTLFCIQNGIASRVNLMIHKLDLDLDTIGALTSVMPMIRTSRGINISGGVTLAKSAFDTGMISDPAVTFCSAMNEGAPISATPGATICQQMLSRAASLAEQVVNPQSLDGTTCLPFPVTERDLVVRPGENLIVQLIGPLAASNAALSNSFNATCIWEEDAIPTFAISGAVTLSGSPVAGAIVTIIEADDLDMTNPILREKIITPAGGTWSSSIRTGKVGSAFVQYRNGGTLYTAPGSPYLA